MTTTIIAIGTIAARHVIAQIGGLNAPASEAAQQRQLSLTKPAGALGRLEELSIQLAGITGELRPPLRPCRVIVCAGDHGVTGGGRQRLSGRSHRADGA
jgi:NaMN:DMB phosphoribosyltransferase